MRYETPGDFGAREDAAARPLFILCPPRSYSSVICAMLGQHPQLHGFPELALFVADTVDGLLDFHQQHREGLWTSAGCSPGLLRALAHLLHGAQTHQTVAKALAWVQARSSWTTKAVCDFLLERIHPRLGIDKSPLTVLFPEFLARAVASYPRARFLHLTRHPVTSQQSLRKQFQARLLRVHPHWEPPAVKRYFADLWCRAHRTILDLTRRLPAEQTMRIRGEDVLRDPDCHLARIARWLGVRHDRQALSTMKHPEQSPYAHFGPGIARGANDPTFLRSPRLRPIAPLPDFELPDEGDLEPGLEEEILDLAAEFDYAARPLPSASRAA